MAQKLKGIALPLLFCAWFITLLVGLVLFGDMVRSSVATLKVTVISRSQSSNVYLVLVPKGFSSVEDAGEECVSVLSDDLLPSRDFVFSDLEPGWYNYFVVETRFHPETHGCSRAVVSFVDERKILNDSDPNDCIVVATWDTVLLEGGNNPPLEVDMNLPPGAPDGKG